MAVVINATSDRFRKATGSFPSTSGDFTVCGWFYFATDRNTYTTIFVLNSTTGSPSGGDGWWLQMNSDGSTLAIWDQDADAWYTAGIGAMTTGNWYHVAIRKNSTNLRGSLRVRTTLTYTTVACDNPPADTFTPANMEFGTDGYSEPTYGNYANWKIWEAALTDDELLQESMRFLPIRRANLWAWYPMIDASGRDYGPNGNNLNVLTGLTVGDNPPISYGAPVVYVVGQATGGGPITGTVNQVSETDLAQAVTRLKNKLLGQNAETDAVQEITRVKQKAVGQASESDSVQAVAKRKLKAAGQNTETDEALQVSRVKYHVVGQAEETDSAQVVSVSMSKVVAVNQVSETDEAFQVSRVKYHGVGQAEETDAAQAFGTQIVVTVNQVTETDAAQAITRIKRKAIGQNTETDAALQVSRVKYHIVGQATEADSLFALTGRKVVILGQAEETDGALGFGTTIFEGMGQVSETDEALAVGRVKIHAMGMAVESDSLFAVAARKVRELGMATEVDYAMAISAPLEISYPGARLVGTSGDELAGKKGDQVVGVKKRQLK